MDNQIPISGEPLVTSPPSPAAGAAPSPFDDFFGASVGKPLEEHYDEMPEEIADVLREHSLDTVKFQCILKRMAEDGTKTNPVYISSWQKKIPSMEFISRVYGEGRYMFVIQWTSSDRETGKKKKNMSESIEFEIGEECRDIHEDYIIDQQIKRIEARKSKIDRAKLKKQLLSGIGDDMSGASPREDAKAYVREIAESAELLGFRKNESFPWKDILPIAMPLLLKLLDNGKNDGMISQLYDKMLQISQQSATHMLEVVRAQSGQGSGNQYIKEFTDMVKGTIDLKEMINGGKEDSAVDKLLELVEKVAPMIVVLMTQGKDQREKSVQYKVARTYAENSPEVAALAHDPEALVEFVNRNDQLWGWRVTDMMLELGTKIGLARPPQCPRLPELELPQDQRPVRETDSVAPPQ